MKQRKRLLSVDQSEYTQNPLLNGVSMDMVPPTQQEWMGSCHNLIMKFNDFQQKSCV